MIKHGVDLRDLAPQMCIAYTIACAVYAKHGAAGQCVITSAKDGKHGPNSLHSRDGICRALDLRTNMLSIDQLNNIGIDLKFSLGKQFDVIVEDDHVHVEWDLKEGLKPNDQA